MKKFISTVLACVLALGIFSGCSLVSKDDGNVVIATVNGVAILKEEYDEIYNYYYYMYTNYYNLDSTTAQGYLENMKESIFNDLIEQEVLRQKAEAAGYFNFTDEERKEAQATIDEDKNSYIESLVAEYESAFEGQTVKGKNEGESDEDYFTRIATEKYLKNLEDNGTSEEEMLKEQLESNAIERFKQDQLKDVTVLESDVITRYNELYESQKQEITTDTLFVSGWNNGYISSSTSSASGSTTNISCDPVLYYRAGYSLVQHILVSFEEDDETALEEYQEDIDELDTEIATLEENLESETDDAKKADYQAQISEKKAERDGKQNKYDILLASAKAKIQAKTDEIYNSVKDGDEANFISVLKEKSEDPGMQTEETAKKGYLVGPEDGMVEAFSTAAKALNEGEISEPVATGYGYHIIRCMKKLAEGKVDFESVKEELTEQLTEEKKNTEWETMLTQWTTDGSVKKYENRL